jgi:putative DNA primase/helicase
LAAKLARFAEDHREDILRARPELPSELNDRAQDNWEPLLAIADTVGGHWPKLARQAALKLAKVNGETMSIGVELLADIQEIFETKRLTRISTTDLIAALCEDDEKAWATYNRGNQIKPRQVAKRLSEYGVTSNQTVRINSSQTAKGYSLDQFQESFNRYLVPAPPPVSVTKSQPANSKPFTVTDRKTLSVTEPSISNKVTKDGTENQRENVTETKMLPIEEKCYRYEKQKVTLKPAPPLTCDRVTDTAPPPAQRVRVTL